MWHISWLSEKVPAPDISPNPHKPMKPQPMIFLGAAISLLMCSTWISDVFADARTPGHISTPAASPLDFPRHKNCVVTVDTRSSPKPVIAGEANIVTGFDAPDAVEGILIRIDSDWLVLRDGCDENWIPRNKVLMIHFCE